MFRRTGIESMLDKKVRQSKPAKEVMKAVIRIASGKAKKPSSQKSPTSDTVNEVKKTVTASDGKANRQRSQKSESSTSDTVVISDADAKANAKDSKVHYIAPDTFWCWR